MGEAPGRRRHARPRPGRAEGAGGVLPRGREFGRVSLRGLRGAMSGPTRRDLLQSVPGGIYAAALASLLARGLRSADARPPADLKPRAPHFAAKAKAVIHLFMNG